MSNNGFQREHKEQRPVLAICYDFDKTLSPEDMQAQGYIQSVGFDVPEFWAECNQLAGQNDMDQNLAYMYKMKEEAEGRLVFNREKLREYGARVELFPGVEDWFARIREFGEQHGVIVEHYVISSGLKEMIEATSVAKEFKKIYASSFYYNQKGIAVWPAQVINYTNKTQFLFRIEKGVLDINDPGVNDSFAPENLRIPFRNIVYIGDSDTDIPCMKLVNTYGGHSIGVYDCRIQDKAKVYKMMREGRIKYFAPADYTEGSEIDRLLKAIILKTEASETLEEMYYQDKKENLAAIRSVDETDLKKQNAIIALENSSNFANTHSVIEQLRQYTSWTEEERQLLTEIAVQNRQVRYILKDGDVKSFFRQLLEGGSILTEPEKELKKLLETEEEA